MLYGLLYTSSTYSIFDTNSLLFCGGSTHPFTFQGLSSFFLRHFLQLHGRCFLHILIPPSCQPITAKTTWHILWEAGYNTSLPTWLQHPHLIFFHRPEY